MRSAGTTGNLKQQFFRYGPPNSQGDTTTGQGEKAPRTSRKEATDQVNNVQTYIHNHLINFKCTFVSHIRGLGVTPIWMTDLPLAGG